MDAIEQRRVVRAHLLWHEPEQRRDGGARVGEAAFAAGLDLVLEQQGGRGVGRAADAQQLVLHLAAGARRQQHQRDRRRLAVAVAAVEHGVGDDAVLGAGLVAHDQ